VVFECISIPENNVKGKIAKQQFTENISRLKDYQKPGKTLLSKDSYSRIVNSLLDRLAFIGYRIHLIRFIRSAVVAAVTPLSFRLFPLLTTA